jgi:nucleolar MIF4G domain-containing protein 1
MARKMRMNTEARKNLFCALMSADDYLDAFERLVKVDKAAAAAGVDWMNLCLVQKISVQTFILLDI